MEEVLREEVYAVALARDQVGSYCNQCLTGMAELKKCSRCRRISYCSQECQRTDWKLHKAECKSIEAHNEVANDSIRLVQRIVVLLGRQEVGEVTAACIPGGTRSFLTLEDHGSALDSDAQMFAAEFMKYALAPHPDPDLVKNIFKKVSINSFVVGNSTGNAIGIGLCVKLSVANHSCKPVTRVCYRNRTAMLVPVSNQLPTTLENACHSYIDELMPKAMRREALKNKYKFDCQCDGCLDDERNARMEAWSCGICVNGWVRNTENAQCELCNWSMTTDHFELCRTAEEAAIASRSKLDSEAIPLETRRHLAEKLLELFQDTLHVFNVHRIPVLRSLYIASLAAKDIGVAAKTGVTLLSIMLEYQNETDPAVLFQKYQLSQLFCAAGASNEALKLLNDIKEPLERIYTADSTIVRNVYCMIVKARNSN